MKRLTVIVALTLLPFAAAAQSTGVLATKRPITWGMIFALLFLMLGPIKLLAPFAAATKDCDRVFRLRLATRAFLFSAAAVTVAGALGQQMLENFAIPVLVLQIAAGLILFLVALQAVMQQYDVTYPPDRTESPCPFRKSYPDVFVMQSAKDWDGSNVADPLNNALQGCVLLQRQMRARTVVISRIGQQDAAQVTLTTD